MEETNQQPISINQSPTIGKLAKAMSTAQGQLNYASKDGKNPFFKSKYATLAAVYAACKDSLSKNNIAVIQVPQMLEGGQGVILKTVLAHESGEWIAGHYPVISKDKTAQGVGSGLTYARRYSLASMVGVAQEDDDGEAAQGREKPVQQNNQHTAKTKPTKPVDRSAPQNRVKSPTTSSQPQGVGKKVESKKPRPVSSKQQIQDVKNLPNMADELNDLFGA